MPRQRRHKTRYSGVFVVDLSSGDQTFYIRFKKEGNLIEERAGCGELQQQSNGS